MGWPATIIAGVVAQMMREGSSANCNPQDTTEPWPGATDFNAAGVKNYRTADDGQAATAATWRNGFYSSVLRAGAAGDPNQWVAAVAASPWGTWISVAQAQADLATVMHDPTIGEIEVVGTLSSPGKEDHMITAYEDTSGQRHVFVLLADGAVAHWWQATSGADTSWHSETLPAAA